MSLRSELGSAFRLTRPRQWPILTAQFAVGIALALPGGAALPIAFANLDYVVLSCGWLVWVVMLNGGTLAYNSAWDRDTGAVAYLRKPPPPPPWLARAAFAAMIAGAVLGTRAVGSAFGAVTALCVALSVAYSHPQARLKSRPGLDLLTNMVGYGAGTTAAGILAGRAALPAGIPAAGPAAVWHSLAFALLFGSFYPLTQLYQMESDRARDDRTLSTRLGAAGALSLALMLGLAALVAMQAALVVGGRADRRGLPGFAIFLWLAHLWRWRSRVAGMDAAAHERGMYRALALWALIDGALVAAWLG